MILASSAFYTQRELSARGRTHAARRNLASTTVLGHYETRTRDTDQFDVFLSHSYADADTILGVVDLLEAQGISIYVDWIVDRHRDRSTVNRQTADLIRKRMRQSRSLIYAVSTSARTSIWMPWELGYFDGISQQKRISILPIDGSTPGEGGQEYLKLYPAIEKVTEHGRSIIAAVEPVNRTYISVREFVLGLS